ncbi:hypothetical protein Tco_0937707 [Tanacetum coccineum]|uniref:Uncharacterized protein n=1 Tax=Tanacetum coccineum TaxID=301880 RepID=A0ABQ5DFS3_9ASTR
MTTGSSIWTIGGWTSLVLPLGSTVSFVTSASTSTMGVEFDGPSILNTASGVLLSIYPSGLAMVLLGREPEPEVEAALEFTILVSKSVYVVHIGFCMFLHNCIISLDKAFKSVFDTPNNPKLDERDLCCMEGKSRVVSDLACENCSLEVYLVIVAIGSRIITIEWATTAVNYNFAQFAFNGSQELELEMSACREVRALTISFNSTTSGDTPEVEAHQYSL